MLIGQTQHRIPIDAPLLDRPGQALRLFGRGSDMQNLRKGVEGIEALLHRHELN